MAQDKSKNVAVIGAGPMGLACAYKLLKDGHRVVVYEGADRIGGMTASFDFDGLKIERFFHFICATDDDYFTLLNELDLLDKLRWVNTRMGFYFDGSLDSWGDPLSLLKFRGLTFWQKMRYGLNVLYCKRVQKWSALDRQLATDWLRKTLGEKLYQVTWEPLLRMKFYELRDEISAAWIVARVQRLAYSRQSLFKEKLGYLEGGSDVLLDGLESAIQNLGGKIVLNALVDRVVVADNQVAGIQVNGTFEEFDRVISTIPLPYVKQFVPALPKQDLAKLDNLRNVGVVTVKFKLRQPLTPYFWVNINDSRIEIPGIIEYSNLNPMPDTIIYVPYYMPQTHPKFSWDNQQFADEAKRYFKMINPDFDDDWVKSYHVSRYFYAQPVCVPGFLDTLPPIKSAIDGFFMADTSYYYPQDRSITESIKLGNKLATMIE